MRTSLHVLQHTIPSRRVTKIHSTRTTDAVPDLRAHRHMPFVPSGTVVALLSLATSCATPLDAPIEFTAADETAACVITWNLNGGVQPGAAATAEATTALLDRLPACDLMVFTEVQPDSAATFQQTLQNNQPSLQFYLGQTGNQQRIMLAWDTRRFEAGTPSEVALPGSDGRGRAPLVVALRDRAMDVDLLVTAVHLRASDDAERDIELDGLTGLLAGRQENQLVVGDLNAGCETSPEIGGYQACAPAFYAFVQAVGLLPLESIDRRSTLCRFSEAGPTPDMLMVTPDWIDASRWIVRLNDTDWCSTMAEGAHRPQGWWLSLR